MSKTIQEQIADMEARCTKLEELHKLFEKMVKAEYGVDAKKLHKMLKNSASSPSYFEEKIRTYYDLKSDQDCNDFLTIFCTENNVNYYNKKRVEYSHAVPEQQG